MTLIHAQDLVKRYGEFTAVNSINFSVEHGECFGFLGPNGAGKSSIMRAIACVSPPSSGTLSVSNLNVSRDSRSIKATLGVVPQEDNLDEDLDVLSNLIIHARYFDIPKQERRSRAYEALEFMGLGAKASSSIYALSGGMKRRLMIARALINRPQILVLDEPTTGLDPQARHLVWQRLRLLKTQGTTMVLSTHYMDEASYLCDRLVIMGQGQILTAGTPQELISKHTGKQVVELRLAPWEKAKAFAALQSKTEAIADGGDSLVLIGLKGRIPKSNFDQEHTVIIKRKGNLEDVFLRLTGRMLEEE